MSQMSPYGRRKRYVHAVALALGFGALSLGLIGCGGGGPQMEAARRDIASKANPGDFNKLNAETYGAIVENEFRSPLVEPRSTFSADVNTASYSNVRRFITQQNKLPPKDAVLLAELVNYFPYRYPNPTGDAPVSLNLEIAPCPWKTDHKLARIGVRAKSLEGSEMPARNLVFLIDTSGSMASENRLPLVKRALNLLIDQLTARDRVTIVTYAGEAGLKLTPTSGDRKQAIRAVVNGLSAGGSTNGEGGIQLAYEMARRSFIEGGANRVILCTDGDFNVGAHNGSELKQLIEKERASRVFLTVLGFGMGNLKNQELETLATHGNGHYAYLDTIDEARKVFVEQGGALVCVAKDVKFQIDFNPAKVAAYRLIGYENRLLNQEDFKNDAKDAGDMGSGHTVTALYEIVPVGVSIDLPAVDPHKYQAPAGTAGNADEWLTVKMRYKHPDGEQSKELAAVLTGAGGARGSEDLRFAAAVAEFGLVLRDSAFKGDANFDAVIERATGASGYDPNGHRKEFVELVRRAKGLTDRANE
ncbi:vWA domain-containing protein [Frigoriglobus tundricola]|uniref:von Willebrand factor n=1 Tax=Frigoriglobus tundricola TaxID=2774151 RepID=A0A6M5YKC0_9BACT|nr:VWA domain-containing protein [Frigoriglobus tundricola]QJW93432.1 von Willebrand factor [Frigoriglobus tundricola]